MIESSRNIERQREDAWLAQVEEARRQVAIIALLEQLHVSTALPVESGVDVYTELMYRLYVVLGRELRKVLRIPPEV